MLNAWTVMSGGDDELLDGRYRLLRRLGAGGMAAVWAARDERLGREVAVKLLSDVLAGDETYRRRFEREARVAAGLNHPGLVGVLDFGTESERPYLVMELVQGETLAARIAAGAHALDVPALATELLEALAYMHGQQVVHRDVKPANVLIGGDGRARLTDFGIAQPRDATALTQTGQLIGTLAYMAPELQRGEAATPRSDLYSLGVLLRECGAARDPALAALVPHLTAAEPSERPASAGDALAMLTQTAPTARKPATDPDATAAAVPIAAAGRTPGLGGQHGRRAAPVLAAALVLAAASAILVALALGGNGESPPDSAPEVAKPRENRDGGAGQPAPDPARPPADAEPEDSSPPSCARLEERKRALEQEKKAAEEAAGDDKAAKKEIKERFQAGKKALEEQAKACPKG